MSVMVFGHKSPDTDSTGSPIIWAWYLKHVKNIDTEPVLLGKPNSEALFMLNYWGIETPQIIDKLDSGSSVVIVDTNNPDELPENINDCEIQTIIDHHKLVGGLQTKHPIDVVIRPLACTATVMIEIMGADITTKMPTMIKGAALSCILSDTLEFRSPTTTDLDRSIAKKLAKDLGIDMKSYAFQLFTAKSDVSNYTDPEIILMDSKKYNVGDKQLRISVMETTKPAEILKRKNSLLKAMEEIEEKEGVDQILFFVIDILKEEATLLVPNNLVKEITEKSFGKSSGEDTIVLPGILSRKKQIIPQLKL
ncbi:manganese-dependent inorganic pyrophosphatase [Paracoccaceae bacterium]|nr:manganese-dependent inorganic pyrophosphatase [Paracoccaceae bacterium]MDB3860246.1 manganese-dependent inorganic pyrophosphatase [Paracoccaceae bacterium]